MEPILQISGLSKDYHMGEVVVQALRGVDLTIYDGEFLVILGPSGSGKSTILNIAGGIDTATSGKILYRSEDIAAFNARRLTQYRRCAVGFVFQFYNLMQNLTAAENVSLAAELSPSPIPTAELMEQIGLADRADHFPAQLSGGQQQRVAIARAIAKNPDLLLCDEPTGALDFSTGVAVLRLLKDFNDRYKKTVVIITHNASIGDMADRVVIVRDGVVERETVNEHPVPPEEVSW